MRAEEKRQRERTFDDGNIGGAQFAVAQLRQERRPVGDLAAYASDGAVVDQKEVRMVRLEIIFDSGPRTGFPPALDSGFVWH